MSDKHKALRSALARDDYTQGKLWFASFAVDVAMLLECHDRLTDDFAAATHLLADRDAQIERLTAELATLRVATASVQADQRAEIDRANAVIDELLADAERYRWLRDGCDNKESEATRIAARCYGMEWDAAIDAARALRKGTT